MNLLQHIRSDRTEKKKKELFKQTLFSRIGGLVKVYALESGFLKEMDHLSDVLLREHPVSYRMRAKPPIHRSLFPLLTEEEYRVTSEIIKRADNPYLCFANSPEEILFCKPLFSYNPGIGAENLIRCHFKTLFLCELAKEKVSDLTQQIRQIREKEDENSLDEQKRVDSLASEIKKLNAFIADAIPDIS